MAAMPNPGLLHVRPSLTRSRSNTSPITPSNLSVGTSALSPQGSQRPSVHSRSKSYVAPSAPSPSSSETLPNAVGKSQESSRFPRLHLPGKHTHTLDDDTKTPLHRRHRFLQTESQQYHKKNDLSKLQESPSESSGTGHGIPPDLLYPGSRGAAIPSLIRMRSSRSYRGAVRQEDGNDIAGQGNTRGRANSDPKSPTHLDGLTDPNNPIEVQLRKGDLFHYAQRQNAKQEDVDRLDARLKGAKVELAARLDTNANSASELMQRLNSAHDTLHHTAESLVDTLSSFSSLAQQSSKLLSNFESETAHLDSALKQRIQRFRKEITTKRAGRVAGLERRAQTVTNKAEDLGRRLENCRVIVKNWEAREIKKRKTWKGVRDGILWGLTLIIIGILAGIFSWKAVQFSDGQGTPEQALGEMIKNESWSDGSLATVDIPDDVRLVLQDIATREKEGIKRENTRRGGNRPQQPVEDAKEDKRVRLLDEL